MALVVGAVGADEVVVPVVQAIHLHQAPGLTGPGNPWMFRGLADVNVPVKRGRLRMDIHDARVTNAVAPAGRGRERKQAKQRNERGHD